MRRCRLRWGGWGGFEALPASGGGLGVEVESERYRYRPVTANQGFRPNVTTQRLRSVELEGRMVGQYQQADIEPAWAPRATATTTP